MVDYMHTKNKGITMPKYLKAHWNGCSISVRPIGWRRIFRPWPYFVGDRIRLKVKIQQGKAAIQPDTLFIGQHTSQDSISIREELIDSILVQNESNQELIQSIESLIISWPCDGRYIIRGGAVNKADKPIMTFRIHPSEKLVFLYVALIGIALGGVIGAITTWALL